MKKFTTIFLIGFLFILNSCSKHNETIPNNIGVYKSYKQVLSPIYAMTKNGMVDGSQIKLVFSNVVSGFPIGFFAGDMYNSGWRENLISYGSDSSFYPRIILSIYENKDPLREPIIIIDSIKLTEKSEAYLYPNHFNFPPKKIEFVKDSIFLKNVIKGMVFKYSPCCLNPTLVIDNTEADLYSTLRGKFQDSEIVLFSYDIYVKFASAYGTHAIPAINYVDLDYLKKELRNDDTLIYVKKETYFKKK